MVSQSNLKRSAIVANGIQLDWFKLNPFESNTDSAKIKWKCILKLTYLRIHTQLYLQNFKYKTDIMFYQIDSCLIKYVKWKYNKGFKIYANIICMQK